jgi:uncharacterized protein with HEPN domain
MTKSSLIYLEHILACIEKIKTYTASLDEKQFLENTLIQDAVIRNFEVIGEATKKIDDDLKLKYASIEWKKIAGMRDKLIHDYIGVDLWAVWAVVEKILPDLELEIRAILRQER